MFYLPTSEELEVLESEYVIVAINPIDYGGGGGAFWPVPSDCQP